MISDICNFTPHSVWFRSTISAGVFVDEFVARAFVWHRRANGDFVVRNALLPGNQVARISLRPLTFRVSIFLSIVRKFSCWNCLCLVYMTWVSLTFDLLYTRASFAHITLHLNGYNINSSLKKDVNISVFYVPNCRVSLLLEANPLNQQNLRWISVLGQATKSRIIIVMTGEWKCGRGKCGSRQQGWKMQE